MVETLNNLLLKAHVAKFDGPRDSYSNNMFNYKKCKKKTVKTCNFLET